MHPKLLHVVAVYSNPIRWNARINAHKAFEEHMLDSGVTLTTVESTIGDRPYELADHPHIKRVRVRRNTVLWTKENDANIAFQAMPEEAQDLALIDADVFFRNKDWAKESVYALDHYSWIQPWTHCYDLGPHGEHLQTHTSFCRQWYKGEYCGFKKHDHKHKPYEFAHPGFAWCFRRSAFNAVGGLFDKGILGAGDRHMAMALIGATEHDLDSMPIQISPGYKRHLMEWERRAVLHCKGNIGHIGGTIEHTWHGKKLDRRYTDRWQIIAKHDYDPDYDIKRNIHGAYELSDRKPGLRDDLDKYFRQRNEDVNHNG